MTPSILDRLEKLSRDATPGEWVKWSHCHGSEHRAEVHARVIGHPLICTGKKNHQPDSDLEFIAAANPATIITLIKVIRMQREAMNNILITGAMEQYTAGLIKDESPQGFNTGIGAQIYNKGLEARAVLAVSNLRKAIAESEKLLEGIGT